MTVEFTGAKFSPTNAADLLDVSVKERKGNDTEVTVLCDLIFKMKSTYEGGLNRTPMCLLVDLGFENSSAKSNEVKTLQHNMLFYKDGGRWQLQTYRRLKQEDGLQFSASADSMAFSLGSPTSGTFVLPSSGTLKKFGLVDSGGKLIELELIDPHFTNGVIKTKKFGDIHATSTSYACTERQIKKLREFLVEQGTK